MHNCEIMSIATGKEQLGRKVRAAAGVAMDAVETTRFYASLQDRSDKLGKIVGKGLDQFGEDAANSSAGSEKLKKAIIPDAVTDKQKELNKQYKEHNDTIESFQKIMERVGGIAGIPKNGPITDEEKEIVERIKVILKEEGEEILTRFDKSPREAMNYMRDIIGEREGAVRGALGRWSISNIGEIPDGELKMRSLSSKIRGMRYHGGVLNPRSLGATSTQENVIGNIKEMVNNKETVKGVEEKLEAMLTAQALVSMVTAVRDAMRKGGGDLKGARTAAVSFYETYRKEMENMAEKTKTRNKVASIIEGGIIIGQMETRLDKLRDLADDAKGLLNDDKSQKGDIIDKVKELNDHNLVFFAAGHAYMDMMNPGDQKKMNDLFKQANAILDEVKDAGKARKDIKFTMGMVNVGKLNAIRAEGGGLISAINASTAAEVLNALQNSSLAAAGALLDHLGNDPEKIATLHRWLQEDANSLKAAVRPTGQTTTVSSVSPATINVAATPSAPPAASTAPP